MNRKKAEQVFHELFYAVLTLLNIGVVLMAIGSHATPRAILVIAGLLALDIGMLWGSRFDVPSNVELI